MRVLLLFGFILSAVFSQAQSKLFEQQVVERLPARDSLWTITTKVPSSQEYDFISEGPEDLEALFLAQMSKISPSRPDELQQSEVLSILAEATTTAWKGTQYEKGKSWTRSIRSIKKFARRSTCRFNLISAVSFRISLVDNAGRRFYYDRHGAESELNLFQGKRPEFKTAEEDTDEPVPLKFFTQEELVHQFLHALRKQSVYGELKSGVYAGAAISIEIDKNTVHKNKIPTARVVVVFGARRLRYLRDQATRSLAILDREN